MNRCFLVGIFLLIYLFSLSDLLSQELISTAGDEFSSASIQLEWSLGESLIETLHDEETFLTQGFHQSYLVKSPESNEIHVYPNPFDLNFTIKIPNPESEKMVCKIWDMTGRLVYLHTNLLISNEINTSEFSFGLFLLQIYDSKSRTMTTRKIIKTFIP